MAKGYSLDKVKDKQENRALNIQDRNFGENVLSNLTRATNGKDVPYIDISDLYSAPSKWNFYDMLDDNKKLELMESIQENGILSPIVVWKINSQTMLTEYTNIDDYNLVGNNYMILAGHNRVDAFVKLYSISQDEKYLRIPAIVFDENDLDINTAKSVIVDTNYVQRNLSTREKVKSVMYKYAELKENKSKKGKTRDIIAEELGMSPTTVFQYMKLNSVIEPLQEMVYDEKIALNSILKIADKSVDIQTWIYETYETQLNNKLLNKVKPYMDKSDIQKLFDKELQLKIQTKKISINVPVGLEDKFKKMCENWIYNQLESDKK